MECVRYPLMVGRNVSEFSYAIDKHGHSAGFTYAELYAPWHAGKGLSDRLRK